MILLEVVLEDAEFYVSQHFLQLAHFKFGYFPALHQN